MNAVIEFLATTDPGPAPFPSMAWIPAGKNVGQPGAIALIRTFLDDFLERDLAAASRRGVA